MAVLVEQVSLKELRTADYDSFVRRVSEAGAELADAQKLAMREHEGVPERARLHPDSIPAPTGNRAKALEIIAKLNTALDRSTISGRNLEPRESLEQQRWKLAITIEQERVVQKYNDKIRNEVLSLRTLKWPNDN
jgi:hypothetical protein